MNLKIQKIGISLCDSYILFLFKSKFLQLYWTFADGISTNKYELPVPFILSPI